MSIFDFRRYKKKQGASKQRHPKLIVSENKTNFGYMGLTEQKYKGQNHRNLPLLDNPRIINKKKRDPRPAYLRKKIEYDKRENFSEPLNNYKLSAKDKKRVSDYLAKKSK